MPTSFLEIVELPDGRIVLRRAEDEEVLVTLDFSGRRQALPAGAACGDCQGDVQCWRSDGGSDDRRRFRPRCRRAARSALSAAAPARPSLHNRQHVLVLAATQQPRRIFRLCAPPRLAALRSLLRVASSIWPSQLMTVWLQPDASALHASSSAPSALRGCSRMMRSRFRPHLRRKLCEGRRAARSVSASGCPSRRRVRAGSA